MNANAIAANCAGAHEIVLKIIEDVIVLETSLLTAPNGNMVRVETLLRRLECVITELDAIVEYCDKGEVERTEEEIRARFEALKRRYSR